MSDLLIVDDDLDVCWILEQVLEQEGHAVRVANDGTQGLRSLQERLPDLVILDVEMPLLDGPQMAYRMFVHNVGLENVPIVLLSGVFDLHAIALRVGTPYFLSKPFDVGQMMRLIGQALGERALPRPSL
jgi:DNA-binding NtrC family response regulator